MCETRPSALQTSAAGEETEVVSTIPLSTLCKYGPGHRWVSRLWGEVVVAWEEATGEQGEGQNSRTRNLVFLLSSPPAYTDQDINLVAHKNFWGFLLIFGFNFSWKMVSGFLLVFFCLFVWLLVFNFFSVCYSRCVFLKAVSLTVSSSVPAWELLLLRLASLSLWSLRYGGWESGAEEGKRLSPSHRQMGPSCLLKTNM